MLKINSKGTTLVEVLVVIFIIAILSLVVWRLMFIGHATFDEGIWRNEREQEVKIGFRTMQEDIKNISGLSATYGTKLALNNTPHFNFYYNSDVSTKTGVTPGNTIFKFYSCRQPLKTGNSNEALNKPAIIEKIEYTLNEKRELIYSKGRGEIPADGFKTEKSIDVIDKFNPESIEFTPLANNKVLIHDISAIKLSPYGNDKEIKKKRPVILKLEMVHITKRGNATKPLLKEILLDMNVTPGKL